MPLSIRAALVVAAATWMGCEPAPPPQTEMNVLTGADLAGPTHFPMGVVETLKLPIPNQVGPAVPEGAHVWAYKFQADSTFRPPDSSILGCKADDQTMYLTCQGQADDERGRWSYDLWFSPDYAQGSFTATLYPDD